jgi:hypothetical protein
MAEDYSYIRFEKTTSSECVAILAFFDCIEPIRTGHIQVSEQQPSGGTSNCNGWFASRPDILKYNGFEEFV